MLSGVLVGLNLFLGRPYLSTTNLVKFHLMALPNKPPPNLDLRYLNRGWALLPFTSIFSKMGKLTP
jgi:hypothetical protein